MLCASVWNQTKKKKNDFDRKKFSLSGLVLGSFFVCMGIDPCGPPPSSRVEFLSASIYY